MRPKVVELTWTGEKANKHKYIHVCNLSAAEDGSKKIPPQKKKKIV